MFNLNKILWPAIRKSWKDRQTDLMGRFDLAWDGVNDPKMLEYNADTPSILIESGPIQKEWFDSKYRGDQAKHQSNYVNAILRDALVKLAKNCSRPMFGQVS
jgi:glutathionylspermidine synthase